MKQKQVDKVNIQKHRKRPKCNVRVYWSFFYLLGCLLFQNIDPHKAHTLIMGVHYLNFPFRYIKRRVIIWKPHFDLNCFNFPTFQTEVITMTNFLLTRVIWIKYLPLIFQLSNTSITWHYTASHGISRHSTSSQSNSQHHTA